MKWPNYTEMNKIKQNAPKQTHTYVDIQLFTNVPKKFDVDTVWIFNKQC